MNASPQTRCPPWLRRHVVPAMSLLACLTMGSGLVTLANLASRPQLSSTEESLVGRWTTGHGAVDTVVELRADRTATVEQRIRLALPGDIVREIGPTTTSGRWQVVDGHLLLETSCDELALSSWQKVRVLVQSQRWPARGGLQRNWELQSLSPVHFGFVDAGSGERGDALRDAATEGTAVASAELVRPRSP